MDKLVLDPATLEKLGALQTATQVFDSSGRLYGTFQPRSELTRIGMTDAEIDAAFARLDNEPIGRPWSEIRADLLRMKR